MLTLQIHLTEPCLILPGAHLHEPISAPPNHGIALQSSLESNDTSTGMDSTKQRPTLNNSLGPLPRRWSAAEAIRMSETSLTSLSSPLELSTEKTTMIRGFVVLHLSHPINLNRLSIKFSGTAQTTGPDPNALVPSCNNTILISEEYTIQDAVSIPAETTPGVPPYSPDPSTSLGSGLERHPSYFSPDHSPSEENQPTRGREGRINNPIRKFSGISPSLKNSISTAPSLGQSRGGRRRSCSNSSGGMSSLSLGSGVSRYFHRRSRSASPLGIRKQTIPLEVDMRVSNSEEQLSSFIMVNNFPEDLAPMCQDSVFNMLANQYNLLGEEGFRLNDQPKSPSYEAHYHSIVSPEIEEGGYARISLTAPDFNQMEMLSPKPICYGDATEGVPNVDRSKRSNSFKNNIGHLFGALKLKSPTFSNSPNPRQVTSPNMGGNHRSLSVKPSQVQRSHYLPGHTTTKLSKSGHIAKRPQTLQRGDSNSSGFQKSMWDRYCPRRWSASPSKTSLNRGIGTPNQGPYLSAMSDSSKHTNSKDLAHEDPFGTSSCSSSATTAVPEQSTTTLLKPGVYKYPIVVPVPNHLPPSLTCDHGCISYLLEARLAYQDSEDPTLLTTHQQIPIDLVDPVAGTPSLNPSCRVQLSGEEDVVNEVFSTYSGICIERSWEEQLYYQIRMDTRKFLVGGKIGFEIQFNPLSTMKIYKFQAEIEEKTQYFMDHEKTYLRHCDSRSFPLVKLEQTSPVVLINKEVDEKFAATKLRASDVPLLPIIATDPIFVTKSPLLPYVNVNSSGKSDEVSFDSPHSEAMAELSKWSEQSGPWNLKFDLRLPGCHSSCKPSPTTVVSEEENSLDNEPKGLNFTCQHPKSPIVVKHYLKLRMRVERGDDVALDKRGRRKKYDIILSSPIQILSCRCKPYSLPAYAFSDPADMSEIISIFKQINTAKEPSTPSLQCNCIARVE